LLDDASVQISLPPLTAIDETAVDELMADITTMTLLLQIQVGIKSLMASGWASALRVVRVVSSRTA
jgi:hypothetical protein